MSAYTILPWLPLDTDAWMNRLQFLSNEAAGALLKCLLASWNAPTRGDEPGTLPSSDTALARLLGPKWRRELAVVREHWSEDPDDPSLLRCEWLTQLYRQQLAKHESSVRRGKTGGWPKGKKRTKTNSPAIAQLKPSSTEGEVDPVGVSFGDPHTGGVVAAVGRGGATSTPPPSAARAEPGDPAPVPVEEVNAWAATRPDLLASAARDVEATLDEDNRGWRDRANGVGIRNRLVEASLAAAYARERRRARDVTTHHATSDAHRTLRGSAHA